MKRLDADWYDPSSPSDILRFGKRLEKKMLCTFVQLDAGDFHDAKDKGGLGWLVEQKYFEVHPKDDSLPDFHEAGVELKVSPLKVLKKSPYGIKERTKLNSINYMTMVDEKWHNSKFLSKNSVLLLVFYWWEKGQALDRATFQLVDLWRFRDQADDLEFIRRDWEIIVGKIREGKAHELSEKDTLILAASTSGYGSLKKQPRSNKLAPERSLSFKPRYIKSVYERMTGKLSAEDMQPLLNGWAKKKVGLEDLVLARFSKHFGKTFKALCKEFDFVPHKKDKGKFDRISREILGVRTKKIEEFEKLHVTLRTMRIDHNGTPEESVSFPYFKFQELVKEVWIDSDLYEMLTAKFLFVIYRVSGDDLILEGCKFWAMPTRDLEEDCHATWRETIRRIRKDELDALPKISEGNVIHVRPHANKSQPLVPGLFGKAHKAQSFWLNAQYLKKELMLGPQS